MKGKSLLLIGTCSGILMLGALFMLFGSRNMWRLWNIPSKSPYFADLRTITGASESLAMGLDPLVSNPGDPWGRPLNYPRIWLTLSARVDQGDTALLGVIFAILFFVGIFLFTPHSLDKASAIALLLFVFSPAVLLGVERGNTDLLIFFLLSAAIALSSTNPAVPRVTGLALMLVGFTLKLFPIFAYPILLKETRRTFYWLSLCGAILVGFYVIMNYHDLLLIRQGTQTGTDLSFGINVLWMWVGSQTPRIETGMKILFLLAVSFGLFAAFSWREDGNGGFVATEATYLSQRGIDAFRIGSGIYIGTFLLGSNWDYRLVFLLFTIPQLILWARSTLGTMTWTARTVLVGILISTWSLVFREPLALLPSGSTLGFLFDELANWAVFFGLAYLLASSTPKWTQDDVSHMFRGRTSRRGSLIILIVTSAILAVGALAYLMILPSDSTGHVVSRYSAPRLMLMTGPVIMLLVSAALLAKTILDREWASQAAHRVYGHRATVRRLGIFGFGAAAALLALVVAIRPNWLEEVNSFHIQRLLPYFVLPSSFLVLLWLTDRMTQSIGPPALPVEEGPGSVPPHLHP